MRTDQPLKYLLHHSFTECTKFLIQNVGAFLTGIQNPFFPPKHVTVTDVTIQNLPTALLKIKEVACNTAASFFPDEFI